MKNTFKIGTAVRVTDRQEWPFGLVGKIIEDYNDNAGRGQRLVEFDVKEAKERGHGPKDNHWYLMTNMITPVKSDTLTIGTPNLATDLSLPPQARKILAHLETGKTITNAESMMVYHVYRLSDVIFKLRNAGYNIPMTMKVDGVGGKYASYKLVK